MKDKAKINKLQDLLKRAIELAEHGDYTNGVVAQGVDEGGIRAWEYLDKIIKEAKNLGVRFGSEDGEETVEALVDPEDLGWVFMISDDDTVFVSPLKHWNEVGFIPDRGIPEDLVYPDMWVPCQDHCFQRQEPTGAINLEKHKRIIRNEFTECGFVEVQWEDGEFARRKTRRKEIGDEWEEDDDGPDPENYEDWKAYNDDYQKFLKERYNG